VALAAASQIGMETVCGAERAAGQSPCVCEVLFREISLVFAVEQVVLRLGQ
jgi:hypothetical protein